jgi:hypothetical protein
VDYTNARDGFEVPPIDLDAAAAELGAAVLLPLGLPIIGCEFYRSDGELNWIGITAGEPEERIRVQTSRNPIEHSALRSAMENVLDSDHRSGIYVDFEYPGAVSMTELSIDGKTHSAVVMTSDQVAAAVCQTVAVVTIIAPLKWIDTSGGWPELISGHGSIPPRQ